MMLRETDENLWASLRVSRHSDSGGSTRSSEKYPGENLCNGDLVKGLTESDYLNGQLEKG